MEFWGMLWTIVFAGSLLIFAVVAVVVTVGGLGDIRALFQRMDERHEEGGG